VQALAAVLGGTQSLHTNSLDEAYALPSEEAVTIALRTQQILAHESGVADVADPLGGSYFVEDLTTRMEAAAKLYIDQIDAMGGMIAAIERGFPQSEIANASYAFQHSIETGERKIVGVNAFTESSAEPIEILQIDESSQEKQVTRLRELKSKRDNARVDETLEALRSVARGTANTMPAILDAVRAYATLGEICEAFRDVFGTYTETNIL
jgi:methylmalonyl-CoA mutase, N-terminal domain